ncbi:putative proteasome-activating nucleotidase [Cladorrhinum sp. PSN259]|nr:putative proteasome-activating nucleotidase [Cladorrhinum sp. PSN259]
MTDIKESHRELFQRWLANIKPDRGDIGLHTYDLVRVAHPDYHVTRATADRVNLLGYAEAGHAKAVPEHNDPRVASTIRTYQSSAGPFQRQKGELGDVVQFGRWSYTWSSTTFIVYYITAAEPNSDPSTFMFVLAPIKPGDENEVHHPQTDALLLEAGIWTSSLHDEIYVWDDNGWVKDAPLFKSIKSASWDDIILPPSVKTSLISDTLGFFDSREVYQSLALSWKRGIILHGVPGNGKTATIKALINSLAEKDIPSLYVKQFDSCRGSKWSIKRIFERARQMAPCLLIFEDLDSLVEDKLRSYFLNEVDGLESNEGILMIGSTNHLSRLDPAIAKRPSRFDRKYHFAIPDLETREEYAKYWRRKLEGKEAGKGFEEGLCPLVAKLTEGFSFAYMRELFVSTLLAIIRGQVGDVEEAGAGEDSASGKDVVIVEGPPKDGDEEGKKRVFPTVETPEEFADNVYFKVLKVQAKILFDQMEDAEEKPKVPRPPGMMPAGFMMPTMMASQIARKK